MHRRSTVGGSKVKASFADTNHETSQRLLDIALDLLASEGPRLNRHALDLRIRLSLPRGETQTHHSGYE